MKSEKGTLSANQRNWRDIVELHGNKYVVCRNIYEFKEAIDAYLGKKF